MSDLDVAASRDYFRIEQEEGDLPIVDLSGLLDLLPPIFHEGSVLLSEGRLILVN